MLSKLSQASMVKIFHFSDEWKVVSVASPINLEVFFKTYWPRQVGYTLRMDLELGMYNQTLCMDLKLGMYNHLDMSEFFKKF